MLRQLVTLLVFFAILHLGRLHIEDDGKAIIIVCAIAKLYCCRGLKAQQFGYLDLRRLAITLANFYELQYR